MARMVRQGDVLLVPVEQPQTTLVRVARERGRIVLAEGELTGHAHVIEAPEAELVSAAEAAELYLFVHGDAAVALRHEEHDTLAVEPGCYRVVRQREFVPTPGEDGELWRWAGD